MFFACLCHYATFSLLGQSTVGYPTASTWVQKALLPPVQSTDPPLGTMRALYIVGACPLDQ